jgi:hypothetical protein
LTLIAFKLEYHLYHCLSLDYYGGLISDIMVNLLHDSMVNTHNGRADDKASQVNGPIPPPPLTLAQAIASILDSRDEQTELLHQLVNNSATGVIGARNAHEQALTTYGEFLATHLLTFAEAGEPLEADHWL